uniref:DUF1643 domain-containing protein n=1 Tax=Magnetococcus massalia (strain MO-1) TaxID=451514 RepID=A0A1S7LEL1_MAGMO|nr:conserved protein of unknown function [Candidatus Magnetococcus massalia]
MPQDLPSLDQRIAHAQSLRAAELKKIFGVYGFFYQTQLAGEPQPCRSVLTLVRHGVTPEPLSGLEALPPDLLVVMMNPGSSRPLQRDDAPTEISQLDQLLKRHWVATQPDNTQYQIMRVMEGMGYRHARVLNISDLRETKSPLLIKKVEYLAKQDGGGLHSLFHPQRRGELQNLMGDDPHIPVIVGWGRHKGLLPLAHQALDALQGWRLIGQQTEEDPALYAHPSPMLQRMKDAWLDKMMRMIDATETGKD